MKKNIFILLASLIGISGFAQKSREERDKQTDINNIKRFFERLKNEKISTKKELLWSYTYFDTTEVTLKKLASDLEKESLVVAEVQKSKKDKTKYQLTVSEIKKYTVETLYERVHSLNEIAKGYKITNEDAVIGAETVPKDEEALKTYKRIR